MSRLGKLLLLVCLLDLAATLWLIHFANASEMNPILNYYLKEWGTIGLIGSKMWLVLMPLFVIETGTRHCPYARRRSGLYYGSVIGLYVLLFTGANVFQLIA